MGTAAYSIHCWLITRLYVFYHKRYGIDDTHRLTLLLRILYGFPCDTRFAVPYCNNVISLVHHITIALVHTIRRIQTMIKTLFVIDYIDLDYGYIGGFYSVGLSGPAYGGGMLESRTTSAAYKYSRSVSAVIYR